MQNETMKKLSQARDLFKIMDISKELENSPSINYGFRPTSKILYAVTHHSGTTEGTAASFARYHVNTKGWPAIGYHYVIDSAGNVFKTNEHDVISYHTSGANEHGIGICLIGNFDKTHPKTSQLCALFLLQTHLKSTYKSLVFTDHSQYKQTSCPGKFFHKAYLRFMLAITV